VYRQLFAEEADGWELAGIYLQVAFGGGKRSHGKQEAGKSVDSAAAACAGRWYKTREVYG
jgi:hypothetical protein